MKQDEALAIIRHIASGDRLSFEGIEEKTFQDKANQFIAFAALQGITLASVYHRPIKTGMIFVKK